MNRLRNLREAAGLTIDQLAEALGLHKQSIVRYQNGSRKPGGPAIKLLAALFGCSELEIEAALEMSEEGTA